MPGLPAAGQPMQAPRLAGAGPELRRALSGQSLVPCTIDPAAPGAHDARASSSPESGWLLTPLDAPALAHAFRRDPFLLEKVARVAAEWRPASLSLVTTDAAQAYPGFLLRESSPAWSLGRVVGECSAPHGDGPRGEPLRMIAGPRLRGSAAEAAPAPANGKRGPGLLVAVPWIVHGGVDRAIVELLHGARSLAPALRCYLVSTLEVEPSMTLAWADEVMGLIDGVFCAPALAPRDPPGFVAELVDRLEIDAVLVANSQAGFDALPEIKRRHPSVRIVSQAHTFPRDQATGELFGHCAYSAGKYDALIDAYAVISHDTADKLMRNFGVAPAKVRLVRIGIDLDRFAAAYRTRLDAEARPQVLWLGRLAPEKDPLQFLRVAKAWKQRHGVKALAFRMIGSGNRAPELRDFAREHDLDDLLTLAPGVDDPVPVLREASCLLITSRFEGIPLVLFEAMAAGLPIVASIAHTSIPEVLGPDAAWFVERQDDVDAYVRALEALFSDRAEARARAERARRRVLEFGRDRYARETLELLLPGSTCR